MNSIPFEELNLIPEIRRAVEALGFETATDIQSQSIPLIQSGRDVIGRSPDRHPARRWPSASRRWKSSTPPCAAAARC